MPRPTGIPHNLDTISQRVRWWRTYRKISRKELAKAAGIGYSTLADLENGEQSSSKAMHLIAAKLRLNPHYLEHGKGEPEAEYAQEAPPESFAWPFSIPKNKVEKLNTVERSYLDSKLFEALSVIESERKKTRA